MKEILEDLFREINRFNNVLENKPLSKKEIAEEKENVSEFVTLVEELKELLIRLKNTSVDDIDQASKNLMQLHV